MSRKICVITGSRAEYGLLKWLMLAIQRETEFFLQTIVTGAHLSPEFGLTYREIEADGFRIDRKVEALTSSDTAVGVAKSMGLAQIGFADALQDMQPDLVLVVGDRFEIFAAVATALVLNIPVAHAHGGETTEGAYDEAFRHSVTKMSQVHFVATDEYRRRVIQLGEAPGRVHVVGGLGVDGIAHFTPIPRTVLESELGVQFGEKSLLVTFHPATVEPGVAASQMDELLASLSKLTDTQLLFTYPNADNEGRALRAMIDEFVAGHSNAKAFPSLGQVRYLSCLSNVDGVVGNSSSGLLEAPSFRIGTVNIGHRQSGRLKAASVIDCEADRDAISVALNELYSKDFLDALPQVVNPYGDGGASERIVEHLRRFPWGATLKKTFFDLPVN